MRLLLLVTVLLAFDYYAFQALQLMISSWPKSARNVAIVVYATLSLLSYLYIFTNNVGFWSNSKSVELYFRAFVFILFFSKLVLGIFLAIDDLRRLALFFANQFGTNESFSLARSKVLGKIGFFFAAIPLVSLTYGMWRNPFRYQVHSHKLQRKNLPKALEGLRIVQISDIHSGTFTQPEPLKKAIDLINNLKADLVFFTGDLVNYSAEEMEPYISIFQGIQAPYGVYSVLGNHDYGDYKQWPSIEAKQANFKKLQQIHKTLGWDLLRNENRVIEINGEEIAVIGVENSSASPRFHNYGDLAKASENTTNSKLKILLSHDPSHWNAEVTKTFKDIDLTLSGHTHGFQFGIEIPGWLKWSPSKYVYKQWAGMYQEGDQHLYVNRGFGMLGYPGRVGILPEITCIDFLAKDTESI
jgi:predicted MPP superfamily phosphohydrolase